MNGGLGRVARGRRTVMNFALLRSASDELFDPFVTYRRTLTRTVMNFYVRETATFRVGERESWSAARHASRTCSPAATYARKTKTTATITAKTVSIFAAGETVAVVVVVGQVTASALMMLSGL